MSDTRIQTASLGQSPARFSLYWHQVVTCKQAEADRRSFSLLIWRILAP
jgi:hypothetical protein